MKRAKAYLNVLKYRINAKLKRQVVGNYPIVAMIDPTSFCNLRCPSCPTGMRLDLRPTMSIPEELFKAAIDEIGDYVFELFLYNWGEPLLHRRTPEMIRYAKEKSIKVTMSSNLSMNLNDEYIERLVLSGLDTLIVSLDGTTQEAYAKYRRRGNFARVRENMSRIRDARERLQVKSPQINWQFVVFRHNEHQIDEVWGLHKRWGADVVNIIPAIMPEAQYSGGLESSTNPLYSWYDPDGPTQAKAMTLWNSGQPCTWLYGGFVLNPNGKVSPCCAVASEKQDFGEYSKGVDFFALWNNKKFKQARSYLANRKDDIAKGKGALKPLSDELHRIDGMAAGLGKEMSADEIVCQKCPIPGVIAWVDPVVENATLGLAKDFLEGRTIRQKSRAVTNYLLMGAPNWNAVLSKVNEEAKRKRGLRFRLGEEIDFTQPSAAIAAQTGWGHPEPCGIWTTSRSADLVLTANRKISHWLVLRAYLEPFLVRTHRHLEVSLSLNGRQAARWHFDLDEPAGVGAVWCEAVFPPSRGVNRLTINFAVDAPTSPFAHGLSADSRDLGVLLKRLKIIEVTEAPYCRKPLADDTAEQRVNLASH